MEATTIARLSLFVLLAGLVWEQRPNTLQYCNLRCYRYNKLNWIFWRTNFYYFRFTRIVITWIWLALQICFLYIEKTLWMFLRLRLTLLKCLILTFLVDLKTLFTTSDHFKLTIKLDLKTLSIANTAGLVYFSFIAQAILFSFIWTERAFFLNLFWYYRQVIVVTSHWKHVVRTIYI